MPRYLPGLLAVTFFVSGCVTPQMQQQRRDNLARTMSSPALCYINYAGDGTDKATAAPELASRGFTCTPQDLVMGQQDYMALQANRHAQQQIDLKAAAALLNNARPPIYVPPIQAPLNCTSQTINGRTYTTCR